MIVVRREAALPTLLNWRLEVIGHVFGISPDQHLIDATREYLRRHLIDDTYIAFFAESEGIDAGCGSICITDELPSPDNPTGRCAWVMSVYVRQGFRNQGVAHAIVERLVEEAKTAGCGKIFLETTAEGRSVYKSIGFDEIPDIMRFYENGNHS